MRPVAFRGSSRARAFPCRSFLTAEGACHGIPVSPVVTARVRRRCRAHQPSAEVAHV